MKTQQIAVVIAAYNAASTIERAVASALASGIGEVLVVDDGSSDNTATLAASCGARVLHQENAGAASARRSGLRNVNEARFVTFLDADDQLILGGVAESVRIAAAAPGPVIVAGVAIGRTARGGESAYQVWNRPVTAKELVQRGYAPGPPGAFLWPRDVIETVMFGPMPAVWPSHAEDFELLIRGASQVPVVSHSEPTLWYALEGGKSALMPTNSIECSERIRSHYSKLFEIPYVRLSARQILGRAQVRNAKTLAANGLRMQWFAAIARAALLDPTFVVHLAWRGGLARLNKWKTSRPGVSQKSSV